MVSPTRVVTAEGVIGEVVWLIDRPYWGMGFATEVGRACITTGFTDMHLVRIVACAFTENTASIRITQKLGMRVVWETAEEVEYDCYPATCYSRQSQPSGRRGGVSPVGRVADASAVQPGLAQNRGSVARPGQWPGDLLHDASIVVGWLCCAAAAPQGLSTQLRGLSDDG